MRALEECLVYVRWRIRPLHLSLEILQELDAFLGQFPVLFDEIVFHAADLRSLERFDPIDAALAHGDLWNSFPVFRGVAL